MIKTVPLISQSKLREEPWLNFSSNHLCRINIFEGVKVLNSRKWLDSQMLCRFLKAQDMLGPFGV